MTKTKKVWKKRGFYGNRFTKIHNSLLVGLNEPSTSNNIGLPSRPISPTLNYVNHSSPKESASASKKKIGDIPSEYDCDIEGNIIIGIDILSQSMMNFCVCKNCKKENSLYLKENIDLRKGLASNVSVICNICGNSYSFWTSSKIGSFFDINIRCVYGLRSIGKGMQSGKTLFGILDLPSPPLRFERYNDVILRSLETVATESMVTATEEAVELNTFNENDMAESEICNPRDLTVAIDGTWQRRGFSSLNGVVSVSSIDSGKILDVQVLTKYCHTCSTMLDKSKPHECKNFEGSSGSMELEGAKTVFCRSEATRNVRYKYYLGDGDSKGFQNVVDSKPYGPEFEIQKLECVGHVQKRMGGRLRKLRREMKGKVLSDGKKIGGRKGRLTDSVIDTLQNYYGEAIRRNKNDLDKMKKDVWATFLHKASSDENPQHHFCDISWCRYKQAIRDKTNYKHDHSLDQAVIEAIKPTYRALSKPELLKKCLHGRTQNVNESFNAVLWSRIPKSNFVGQKTLKFGTLDAVITFNEGNKGRIKVLKKLGVKLGMNCLKILHGIDCDRVSKAERANQTLHKQARRKSRMVKKRLVDKEKKKEDPEYSAGMF